MINESFEVSRENWNSHEINFIAALLSSLRLCWGDLVRNFKFIKLVVKVSPDVDFNGAIIIHQVIFDSFLDLSF